MRISLDDIKGIANGGPTEIKYMYTNAPASDVSKMPEPFQKATKNTQLWGSERAQGSDTTVCWIMMFLKDNTQDVAFTI